MELNKKNNKLSKKITIKTKKNKDKKNKEVKPIEKYEDRKSLIKPYLYFTVVNKGVGSLVISLFESIGCSACVVLQGEGTASKDMMDLFNFEDNKKEVIMTFVRESELARVQHELETFFEIGKKYKGVGFAISVEALQGIRVYEFLMRITRRNDDGKRN